MNDAGGKGLLNRILILGLQPSDSIPVIYGTSSAAARVAKVGTAVNLL